MDGQPLTLTWQTNIPAHTSGQAAILITGKQNNQSFTRSFEYMVDQTLSRDAQPGSTYTVSFNTTGGSQAPQPQQIPYPYGRVQRPNPDPTHNGYQFDGWFTGNTAYNFSTPVTENIMLAARWTSKTPETRGPSAPTREASQAMRPPPSPRHTVAAALI